MNSIEAMATLDCIFSAPGRSTKEELLAHALEDPFFERIVIYACNPFITFGVNPTRLKGRGVTSFDSGTRAVWNILDLLAERRLTGKLAAETIDRLAGLLDPVSTELLRRILIKDLRCGVTAKTISKLKPALIPQFPVMLAHKFETETIHKRIHAWPVSVEPKLDGVRVICVVRNGRAEFFSRTGRPFPAVDHLAGVVQDFVARATIAEIPDASLRSGLSALLDSGNHSVVFDGEIVSGSFSETVSQVRRTSEAAEDAEYHIFDVLPLKTFESAGAKAVGMSYRVRRMFLDLMFDLVRPERLKLIARYEASSVEDIHRLYEHFRALGLEGAIVKPHSSPYEFKRSYGWLKMKAEESEDLRVIGAFEGTGKYEGQLGGLIVDRDGVQVRVGGGFTDEQRIEFWKAYNLDRAHGHASDPRPFELIGRLIEVEFHEVTPDGSLRHPRFKRFRDDKDHRAAA